MTSTDESGLRPTRQRTAVVEAIGSVGGFRSAQEIHALLESRGEPVGLATVYRTLQRLADAGEVDQLRAEAGEVTYRRCSGSHHHHLVCRGCGTTVEVAGPTVERWTRAVADQHGFVDVSHTLEVFGTCKPCQSRGVTAYSRGMSEGRFSRLPEPIRLEDVITSQDVHSEEPLISAVEDSWLIRNAAG